MDERPESTSDDKPIEAEERGPVRCRACDIEISDPEAVFAIGGDTIQIHINPHGIAFEVVSLSRARNLVLRGGPMRADSWYPGYAWTIAWCGGCGQHLGWVFDALGDGRPSRFFGLVVGRLKGL